jgi:Fur family peroxide stress response transcriptional regulator
MDVAKSIIIERLNNCGLKITPQRIAVLEVLAKSHDHPTVESILKRVLETIPGISATTIYNALDTFVEKGLVKRVKTDADVMRYELVTAHHHHLYCYDSDRMEDYYDEELDQLLKNYFDRKKIENFIIKEIRLQFMGDFQIKLIHNLKN